MGDIYERELKGVLGGEQKFIEKVARALEPSEREAYRRLESKHFLVVKAGGSFGVDLVAVRGNFAFPIEVKSSASGVFRFSKSDKLESQAERMRTVCEHSSLVPTYAYRLKNAGGDPWRLFTFSDIGDGLEGRHRLLFRRLPKIGVTNEGNRIMHWEDGLKLSSFIDYFMEVF